MPKTTPLRALFAFSTVGLLAELVLTRHWDGVWQVIPLVLLVLGLATLLMPMNLRAAQGVMALLILSGLVGIALHYAGKIAFARERNQALAGWALVRESLKGSSPPILAPGAMIALGLLGLIAVVKNPTSHKGEAR
jgi:hypothetical protein